MIGAVKALRRALGVGVEGRAEADPGYGGLAAFVGYLRGAMTSAGIYVTPQKALEIPDFAACVAIHSEAMARLPIEVYKRLPDGGKEKAVGHPLRRVLRVETSQEHTAAEWKSLQQTDIENYGNSYSLKIEIAGVIRELLHLEARRVEKKRTATGEVFFQVYDEQGTGTPRTYSPKRILHQRGPFGTGLMARAPADQYRELFGIAYALERFIGASFKNGLRPSLIFGTDKILTDKTRKNTEDWLQSEYSGSDKAAVAMVLEDGLKPLPFSQNFEQAQVAALSDVVGLKIARVERVPAHMLQYNIAQPRANMEQQAREYLEMGLGSRIERQEQRLNLELFDGGEGDFFCEYLLDDLLKSDPGVRGQFYEKLVNTGVMTRNEVRQRENLNKLPGLDEPLTPANMNRGDERRGGPPAAAPPAREDDEEEDAKDPSVSVVVHNHPVPQSIHTTVEGAEVAVNPDIHVHHDGKSVPTKTTRRVVRDAAGNIVRVEEQTSPAPKED